MFETQPADYTARSVTLLAKREIRLAGMSDVVVSVSTRDQGNGTFATVVEMISDKAKVAAVGAVLRDSGFEMIAISHDSARFVFIPTGRAVAQPTAPMPALTDHTGWGVIADVAGTVRCVGVHATRDESEACATWRGVRPAAAPCCSLWSRGVDCGCADAAEMTATGFETEDDDEVEPVDNRSEGNRLVLDNTEIGLVLGTSSNPVTGDTNGIDLLIDGSVRNITLTTLNLCDVKAVCGHGYGPNDSCPGCDHDDEVIRNAPDAYRIYITERVADKLGALIDLGILVWHTEDNSCSALLRTGTIVARHVSHDSAKRALELDHKVRSLPGAYNENVIRDLVRQREIDEQAEVANVRLQHQVGKLVRQLIAHGVTTAEQFILACERVERDDALTQAMEEDLVFPTVSVADLPPFLRDGRPERASAHVADLRGFRPDEVILGPANLWGRRDDCRVLPEIRMTAAEAFETIDFSGHAVGNKASVPDSHAAEAHDRLTWSHVDHAALLDSLEHTHPVVTDVNDGSAL